MAKPIEPTPTLTLKESIRFVERMIEEEKNPNPRRIALIRKAMKRKFKVIIRD